MHVARWTLLAVAPATMALAAWLTGCGGEAAKSTGTSSEALLAGATAEAGVPAPLAGPPARSLQSADPIVVLQTTAGDIKIQLFADKSPQTVDNFLSTYASQGFYEGTIFHHVEPGSMLIGGGYTAELAPKPVRTPIYNESRNGLSNRRGTVAMIRDPDLPHSATSQFYINLADNPQLDFHSAAEEDVPGYCVFGQVIEGLDVVERIAQMPTAVHGEFPKVPSPPVAIKSVQRLR